ncbi:MAG: LamG domain-containing protein [Prevotellaceae bacterium]|jgi:hypothetical protein|nr:LamG domain-containing protein [Prevotellaceae bacterium]
MDRNNIVLDMPFNEFDGSVAYDYSNSRTDGFVSVAKFVDGIDLNAIEFDGSGVCQISNNKINLSKDLSVLCWIKLTKIDGETSQPLTWTITFTDESEIKLPFTAEPDIWILIALVKSGNDYNFYLNYELIDTQTNSGAIENINLEQNISAKEYAIGCFDNLKVYNIALTLDEIKTETTVNPTKLRYLINGADFINFGIYVSESEGVVNRPKLKALKTEQWDNYHGETVDLQHKFIEPREITLSCFIKAENKNIFLKKLFAFEEILAQNNTHRLTIELLATKPLIYEVYCKDGVTIQKRWNDRLMTGTFKLKLIEPEPVKRLLKHIYSDESQKTSTVIISSQKLLNIYWGDGKVDFDLHGTNTEIKHDYELQGEYYPLITGDIDKITEFTTNDIVVWNKF